MSPRPCPVCDEPGVGPVLERNGAPVFCNVLWPSETEAREAATGVIALRWCDACEMLWNGAFEPRLAEYAPGYENSLHASAVFGRYAEELAERLVGRYGLRGKTIVDVGSGRGEFLALLCAGGQNRGLGFDPSLPDEDTAGPAETVRLVRDLYTEEHARAARPDLVSCRHVLEHVDDPLGFLEGLRRGLDGSPEAILYLEVPSGDWIVRERAVWDVIYEHPSYFTKASLARLLARAGFRVLDLGTSFGDQYLWAEAAPEGAVRPEPTAEANGLAELVEPFGRAFAEEVAAWDGRLEALRGEGAVALWGAGSKGITFLTSVPAAGEIRFVVDLNARKHHRFVPVTGQAVEPPAALAANPPSAVVAMNLLYADEIAGSLAELGVDAEVLVA